MDDSKNKPDNKPDSSGLAKKKVFGTLKPLTALQIISLIVPSSPAGAGACY